MAYSYSEIGWGNYDDGIEDLTDFHRARKRLGFPDETSMYSPIGEVKFYSRAGGARVKWSFNFVFLIKMGEGGYYWVWVDTLPSMFKFLKETQITSEMGITSYLEATWFKQMVDELHTFMDMANSHGLRVNIQP